MSAQIAHHVKITAGPSSHTPGALMQVQRFVTGLYTSVTTSLTLRVSHVACHHGSGIPHLWRSSPYWGFFVFIFFFFAMFPCFHQMARIYKHPSQHATHGLTFLAPVAVLSVGGVCEKERGREEKSVEAMVQSPDGFKQTPSKAKDEVNHLGAILLEGIWLGLWTEHMALVVREKNREWNGTREEGRKLYNLMNGFLAVWRHHVASCECGFKLYWFALKCVSELK